MNKLLLALTCISLSSCMKNATVTCYSNGNLIYHTESAQSVVITEGGAFNIVEKDGSYRQIKADCIVSDNPQGK